MTLDELFKRLHNSNLSLSVARTQFLGTRYTISGYCDCQQFSGSVVIQDCAYHGDAPLPMRNLEHLLEQAERSVAESKTKLSKTIPEVSIPAAFFGGPIDGRLQVLLKGELANNETRNDDGTIERSFYKPRLLDGQFVTDMERQLHLRLSGLELSPRRYSRGR